MAKFYDLLIFDSTRQNLLMYCDYDDDLKSNSNTIEEALSPAYIGDNDTFKIYNCYCMDLYGGSYILLVLVKGTTDNKKAFFLGERNDFTLSVGDNIINVFRADSEDNIVIGINQEGQIDDLEWTNFPKTTEDFDKLELVFNTAKYIDEFRNEHDKYSDYI